MSDGSRRPAARCAAVLLLLLAGGGCATAPRGVPAGVVPHRAWEARPPVGHVADATRRNLVQGGSLEHGELSLRLLGMEPAAAPLAGDAAVLELHAAGRSEQVTVQEGRAFNWGGYHVALLAANTRGDQLGGGLAELEVATIESLPREVAEAEVAGDATYRLRIPHEIHTITLHHSGSPEPLRPEDDPIAKLRGLQSWGQAERNWWDVPYHLLIDLEGTVYEGRDWRFMGETNTEYDPRGHLLISVLGNYDLQEPTKEQLAAITRMMVWAASEFGVPPERIYGHRDHADTSCPGRHLSKYLADGTFQEAVRRSLRRAGGAR